MTIQSRDWLLYGQVALIDKVRCLARRLRDRAAAGVRDERGQTPTEYLMIVGLMAVVIVIVFVTFYWAQVKVAASTWVENVRQSITGASITP